MGIWGMAVVIGIGPLNSPPNSYFKSNAPHSQVCKVHHPKGAAKDRETTVPPSPISGSACGMLCNSVRCQGTVFGVWCSPHTQGSEKSSKKSRFQRTAAQLHARRWQKTSGGVLPEAVRAARKAVGNPADHAPRNPQSAPVARPDGLARLGALPLAARAHIGWCWALVPTISAHREGCNATQW